MTENFKSFKMINLKKWGEMIQQIFENEIPANFEWTNIKEIINILNIIGEFDANHLFFPTGGGMDLSKVEMADEVGCIKLFFGGNSFDIIKPTRLLFHSFGEEFEWAYFRIETGDLQPTGIYSNVDEYEEVIDLGNANYIDRFYWEQGYYIDGKGIEQKLPYEATVVTRFFNGAFVIFAKASIYNSVSGTYDGRHNHMSDERFKIYIQTAINSIHNRKQNREVEGI